MLHARTVRSSIHILIFAALLASFTFGIQVPAPANADGGLTVRNVTSGLDLSNAIRTPDGKVRVIVELAQPSLATYTGTISGLSATSPQALGAKINVNSVASVAYINYLNTAQNTFVQSLAQAAPSATEVRRFQIAINAVSLAIAPAEVASLNKVPNVLHVYPDQLRKVQLDASLGLIDAQAAWTLLGTRQTAGSGVIVADIDTGLRVANPMFSGAGFTMPAGYPKGYCADNPSDPNFQCNAKVIAARAIAPTPDILPLAAEEVNSPLDIDGHGSHTAGTAVGDLVTAVPWNLQISGVAPGAYLMIYKALYESADHSTAQGSDTMLVEALNDAVGDGADIINNSWGGGAGVDPKDVVYDTLLHNITAAGTLVVFSAGNDGTSGSSTIGCPGCVPDALTVAASTTNRTFAANLSVDSTTPPSTIPANLQNIQGSSVLSASVTAPVVDLAVEGYADPLACTPLPSGSFTGKIVMVKRGTCTLVGKVENAKAGGAVGVVIRNVAGGSQTLPIIQPVLPTIHIAQTDGDALVAFLTQAKTAGETVTMTLHGPAQRLTNVQPDVVADFSSEGPDGDPNYLKPDITAPGVNILSALSPALTGGSDPYYGIESGTSMSAPHVTGAAALMKALYPGLSPHQLKTALTTTAKRDGVFAADGTTPANAFLMGAGRLDLGRATHLGVVFDSGSFAAGNCLVTCQWTDTIQNVSADTVTWSAQIAAPFALGLTVSPNTFTLAPGLSGTFTVTANGLNIGTSDWNLGSITWVPSLTQYTPAVLPVTVLGGTATNRFLFEMSSDKPVISGVDTVTYSVQIANPYTTAAKFYLNDPIPSGSTYVSGSATGGTVTVDPATNTLKATVPLPAAQIGIQTSANAPAFIDIDGGLGTMDLTQACVTSCVDEALELTGMDYMYMGNHYRNIGISTDGYLQAGVATVSTGTNQRLPDPAEPNNVIAPLWTSLRYGTTSKLLAGTDPTRRYTIIEWKNVLAASDTTRSFTFEVLLDNLTGQISFAYGTLGNLSGISATVGEENASGSVGFNYYANVSGTSSGTAPVSNLSLAVNSMPSATLTFAFKVIGPSQQGKVVNIATVANSLNTDVQTAVVQAPFQVGQLGPNALWFPVINRGQ